jgi:ferredoxin
MERSEMRDGVGWQSFRAEAVSVCLPLCGEWTVRSYAPRRRIHHPTPPLISFASTLPLQGRVSELICPSGKSPPNAQNLSSPRAKNISLFPKPKSVVMFAPSRPHKRGGSRSSRTLRRDAVDANSVARRAHWCGRRRRVVLAPRRCAKLAMMLRIIGNDGGNVGCIRCLRCEYSCAYSNYKAHTRLRVHWAPGIPRALLLIEGGSCNDSGALAPRGLGCMSGFVVIARSAATKQSTLSSPHDGLLRFARDDGCAL